MASKPLSLLVVVVSLWLWSRSKRKRTKKICNGVWDLIGNTPMIYLESLSRVTGCTILAKAEFVNPGGSTKDRIGKQIIYEAEVNGSLKQGGTVVEGTAGSTGISLAMIAKARGYNCHIIMQDDMSKEKSDLLEQLGATVERVRPASIISSENFVRLAEKRARAIPNAVFANQFENLANFRAHYETTGPEIWKQCCGKIDAVVMAAGTGGTIAGVSRFLKEKNPKIKVYLIDPPGSSLFNKVNRGVCYTPEEAEGLRLRHPFDTITEGIGINRVTKNFDCAVIDRAFKGTDREAVEMGHYLIRNEGLFVGSSSAMNCVGAVKVARELGPGHTIVTILCDNGFRHMSKFYSHDYLESMGLLPIATVDDDRTIAFVS